MKVDVIQNEKPMRILQNIFKYKAPSIQDFLDYALHEALKLTDSAFGYIYHYNEDKKEFTLNSWSNEVMKKCLIRDKQTVYELEKTSIWGEAVRQRQPIVVNDFQANHPLKKGFPEGHAPLFNFMTLPIFKGEKIVAVVGVANKKTNYNDTDILQLTLFMDTVWLMMDYKKSEIELLKLSTAVNQSPASILITDIKGKIEYANPKVSKISGYSLEEIIGKNPRMFSAGEKSTIDYQQLWNTITKGKEWYGEFHNKRKNGTFYWESASIAPVINSKGAIINFLAIKEDITAKKRAEKIQNILLNISNASQTITELGEFIQFIQKELGKIVNTKNFFMALYNEDKDTINLPYYQDEKDNVVDFPAGKTITGLVIKQGKSLLISESAMDKLTKNGEIDMVGENSKLWLGVPLKIKGKVRGAFVVQSYEDENAYTEDDKEILEIISNQIGFLIDRKQLENEKIIALEKAKESDKLKTAFLANISHEIRTPMNAILGFSEILMNGTLPETKKEKYNELINESGKRLMTLLSDIVYVSKLDATQITVNDSVFNLNKLLDNLLQQFTNSSLRKNVIIKTVKPKIDANSFINLDENLLTKVFSNLLRNSIKFTTKGFVEIGYTLSLDEIIFYVKDTGIGINEEDQQFIFDSFNQTSNDNLILNDGIGIGLAIAKKIVELFGGKIWVESVPKEGSTFYFTIPNCWVNYNKSSNIEEVNREKNRLQKTVTLLIAEDELSNFMFLEAILEDYNFNLIHVENGRDAVETFKKNENIDLILMDFNMPIMDGLEATKAIRKSDNSIPIIALTAYAMSTDKVKGIEAGCTDFITKPFSKTTLLDTINKHVKLQLLV